MAVAALQRGEMSYFGTLVCEYRKYTFIPGPTWLSPKRIELEELEKRNEGLTITERAPT